jgi:hypothetical protein
MPSFITNRDLRLFWWVNGWGAVTVELIAVWMGVDFSTAARRVRKLIAGGFLRRIEVVGLREQAVVVTEDGRRAANDPLAPLPGVRLSTWQHDCQMCAFEPRILRGGPDGVLHPERRIRSNRALAGAPSGHVPDAELERARGGAIAFEWELSPKAPQKIQAILDGYATSQYAAVYYLVPDERMARYVRRFTGGLEDLIKVQLINTSPNSGQAREK